MAAASEEGCDNKSLAFTFRNRFHSLFLSLSPFGKKYFLRLLLRQKGRAVAAGGRVARRDRGEQQLSKRARARSRAPYLQLTTHTRESTRLTKVTVLSRYRG